MPVGFSSKTTEYYGSMNHQIFINFLMVDIESVPEVWAGSIEVAVTSHDPEDTILAPTLTSMPPGRWMLSGRSVIVNGQEAKSGYSSVNIETPTKFIRLSCHYY